MKVIARERSTLRAFSAILLFYIGNCIKQIYCGNTLRNVRTRQVEINANAAHGLEREFFEEKRGEFDADYISFSRWRKPMEFINLLLCFQVEIRFSVFVVDLGVVREPEKTHLVTKDKVLHCYKIYINE
jgi:hypothetical protein